MKPVTTMLLLLLVLFGAWVLQGCGENRGENHSISGTVSGAAVSGVTMSLTWVQPAFDANTKITETDSSGNYSFNNLANGRYIITSSFAGSDSYSPDGLYGFSPDSLPVTVSGADVADMNFTAFARFDFPYGVAVDESGNVYVADYFNCIIWKFTPSGLARILAGTAMECGSADGTGAAARFLQPASVAADGSGNVYVADFWNNTIRKITPEGVVSTLAGTAGQSGSADGMGAAARFLNPFGVAVDRSGNVYVAEEGNDTIRKITSAGEVSTLAGTAGQSGSADGTGVAARFSGPTGIVVDESGNIYVADTANQTIRKITPAGEVSTLAGTAGQSGSTDGTGVAAQFHYPLGIAVDGSGNIYVADAYNNTIRKVTPAEAVSTFAGTAGQSGRADGSGAAAQFDYPQSLAVDESGNVYVADTGNNTIRKITPAGVVSTFAGAP